MGSPDELKVMGFFYKHPALPTSWLTEKDKSR